MPGISGEGGGASRMIVVSADLLPALMIPP